MHALYAAEMRAIWQAGWIFAGFAIEIPNPGDFLTLSIDGSSMLVIRDDDGEVRAFHNVCRHRGTQLCRTESGHVRAIVCPYHSWTYSRRGELLSCARHGRGCGQVAAWLEGGARGSRRRPHLRVACGNAAVVRRTARALRRDGRAAGLRAGTHREGHRLRSRRELEARVGEQPRVLPLHPLPSAVRQGEFRRLRRGRRVRGDAPRRLRPRSRAPRRSGPRRASRSPTPRVDSHRFRTRIATRGTQPIARC